MRVNAEDYQEGHPKFSLPLTIVNTVASNLIGEIRPTRKYKNSFQVHVHPPSQIFNPKLASLDLGTPSGLLSLLYFLRSYQSINVLTSA